MKCNLLRARAPATTLVCFFRELNATNINAVICLSPQRVDHVIQ
jgi:hypothetical protein